MPFRCLPVHWRRPLPYVVISSTLFSLFHWWQGPSGVVSTAIFGAFMAIVYYATRNIWPVAVTHAAVDALWFARIP